MYWHGRITLQKKKKYLEYLYVSQTIYSTYQTKCFLMHSFNNHNSSSACLLWWSQFKLVYLTYLLLLPLKDHAWMQILDAFSFLLQDKKKRDKKEDHSHVCN